MEVQEDDMKKESWSQVTTGTGQLRSSEGSGEQRVKEDRRGRSHVRRAAQELSSLCLKILAAAQDRDGRKGRLKTGSHAGDMRKVQAAPEGRAKPQ